MLRTVLVVGLCVGFALCDTLFFRPFGGWGNEDEDTKDPNPLCPDKQGSCPEKSTCCQLESGKYGCCPLPHAVCCSDYTHCCPEGFTCDVSGGACKRGNLVIDWLQQISSKTQPGTGLKTEPASKKFMSTKPGAGLKSNQVGGKPVPCPGGHVECPAGSTCCQLNDKSYGCCPMLEAACCNDHQHCCPKGYKCTSKATCEKTKGQGTILWIDLVVGNNRHDYKVSKSAKTTNERINPSSESGYQKSKFAPPKVTGQKSSSKEIPRTDDDDDDDDESEEDFQQQKDKISDVKRRKDNKQSKQVSNAQEITKPKPVSKKAKENVNIRINDGNKGIKSKTGEEKPLLKQKLTDGAKGHKGDTKGPATSHKHDKGDMKKVTVGHKGNTKNPTTHKGDERNKGNQKNTNNPSSKHKGKSTQVPKSTKETHKGSTTKQNLASKGSPAIKSAQLTGKMPMQKMQAKATHTASKQSPKSAAKASLPAKGTGPVGKVQPPTSKTQTTVIKQQPAKTKLQPKPVIPVSKAKSTAKLSTNQAVSKSAPVKQSPAKVPVAVQKPVQSKKEVGKGAHTPEVANKPFKVPVKTPTKDEHQDSDGDSTGVRKLVYKLGMMTQKIKRLLMDSLLDNNVDKVEHPDKDNSKDKKSSKPSKISKTQGSDTAGKTSAGNNPPGKGKDTQKVKVTLPVKPNPVIKQSVKIGTDSVLKKTDHKQKESKIGKVPALDSKTKSQVMLSANKASTDKTKQQHSKAKVQPMSPKAKSNSPTVQVPKKKTNVSPQQSTKTKTNVSPSQPTKSTTNISPQQPGKTKPIVSPKQSTKAKVNVPVKAKVTKPVTSQMQKAKSNVQRPSIKQQSAAGKPPIGQSKAPINKQKLNLNPPSRVVKPVAKDVPAQKTTQSIGIKKNVKTNVIDGIPSANLKVLKQQLLKRNQNLNVKQQQAVKPPLVNQPKKQPDMKTQGIKPPSKPQQNQQKVNINIPKTAKARGNPK